MGPGKTEKTEYYNGTTLTEVGDLNTARRGFGGFNGTQSAALANWWLCKFTK